jgi:hypothetical protein
MKTSAIAVAAVLAAAIPYPAHAQASQTTRAIANIRGDLYSAQDGPDFTVFLATSDGIILGDPLNTGLAVWLKDELGRRFPGRPVKYVVQTRHDFERASGAWTFHDTAEIVSQETFDHERREAAFQLPLSLAGLDTNRNGRLEASEIRGSDREKLLRSLDVNSDGVVTPSELYSRVSAATTAYTSFRTIRLGGKTVELVHPGPFHAPDETVLFFPEERTLFAVETVSSLPASFHPDVRALLSWLRTIDALAFDTLITGSGDVQPKNELTAVHQDLEGLISTVSAGLRGGQTIDQIRARVPAENHVSELYESLRIVSTDVYGVALADLGNDGSFCRMLDPIRQPTCTSFGGTSPLGMLGFALNRGRIGGAIEIGTHQLAADTSDVFFASFSSRRDTELTFLLRYTTRVQRSFASAVAGVSISRARTTRTSTFIGAYPPGLPPLSSTYSQTETEAGLTGGVDFTLSLRPRLSVVVPLRLQYQPSAGPLWPPWHYRGGAGLQVSLARRVE